jgi:imidazolonepropionase-like amidohydrolase
MRMIGPARPAFRGMPAIAVGLATALACHGSIAADSPRAFVGARLVPISGPPIDDGTLIVADGRILALGPALATPVPEDAERIDATGWVIMPGLIDTHSHVGGGWGGDASGPIQPDVRVLDSINVRDSGFRKCRAGGLTTLNIMPGSGHLMGGQTVYVKLRRAESIDDMLYRGPDGTMLYGMKMANGSNPRKEPPFPLSRGKAAALVRQKFLQAIEYRRRLQEAGGQDEPRPDRSLEMEGLLDVLEGRAVVHHHAHRADDILTVLRLRDEFGFKVVLHHAVEAWKVADAIARSGATCSLLVLDSPGGKLELVDAAIETGGILERANVPVALHTDDPVIDSRLFLRTAGLAVRGGMTREKALEALTLAGARMLELDHRIGTLEPGKDADLVVLSGDPLSLHTKVLQTWVEGRKVFDRSDPEDRLFAVGGYGAGTDQAAQACCTGVTLMEGSR